MPQLPRKWKGWPYRHEIRLKHYSLDSGDSADMDTTSLNPPFGSFIQNKLFCGKSGFFWFSQVNVKEMVGFPNFEKIFHNVYWIAWAVGNWMVWRRSEDHPEFREVCFSWYSCLHVTTSDLRPPRLQKVPKITDFVKNRHFLQSGWSQITCSDM